MSAENVEIVRRLTAMSATGDVESGLELLAPDVELHLSGIFPDLDKVYVGHDGAREFTLMLREPWEEFALEPERFVDLGERVLVVSHFRGRGREGIETTLPMTHVWTVRDGLIARMDAYANPADAFEAVGLPPP